MNAKMKGLLKGLRYISQIFEPNSKEQEMQIGYPTDVKHVAHIGWDGPSVNPPSWMNEFRSAPLSSIGAEAMGDVAPARFPSHDFNTNGLIQDSPDPLRLPKPSRKNRSVSDSPNRAPFSDSPSGGDLPELPMPRPSRRQTQQRAASAEASSSEPSSSGIPRRIRSSEGSPVGSPPPANNPTNGSIRQARKQNRVKEPRTGAESPVNELVPGIPKQQRKKKSSSNKGSTSGDGSSRSKTISRLPDPGIEECNTEVTGDR